MDPSRIPLAVDTIAAVTGTGEERISTAHMRARSLKRRRAGRLIVARAGKREAFGDLMGHERLDAGDSMHLLSRGHFDTASIPEWFATHIGRIERMTASSLTISAQAVAAMERLDEAGLIGEARIIVQDLTMSRSDNRANIEAIRRWMQNPDHTLRIAESHAKVIVLEFADAPTVVIEASANLSSNDNRLEQYAIHADDGLAAFHLEWLNEVFAWTQEALPRSWFPSPLSPTQIHTPGGAP